MVLGKVISTPTGPTPQEYSFTVDKNKIVKREQFVSVKTEEGLMIGIVDNIMKTNRYYSNPDAVFDAKNLEDLLPVDEFEFLLANVNVLGVVDKNGFIKRASIPPSPGSLVEEANENILKKFLGLDEKGLNIGKLFHHDIEAKLNLTKLIQKHLAILAMSGAGKSYLTSVLLEELLDRKKEDGRIAIFMFDVHGEYAGFAEKIKDNKLVDYSDKVYRIIGMKIPVPNLSAHEFKLFTRLSAPQVRELLKIMKKMPALYNISDLIREIEQSKINKNTQSALISSLYELDSLGIFGEKEVVYVKNEEDEIPKVMSLLDVIKPGKMAIFDLSNILSMKTKQIIVTYLAYRLFKLRRNEKIPPILLVLEEAHNFIPQDRSREDAPARGIFETISREGRKFFCSLCIISQRPINLSTTVLSQCNTQIILRITNPNDLDQIGRSSEGISSRTLKAITSLQVGEALIVGEAVRFPIFVKVRERKSYEKKGKTLEEAAIEWEKRLEEVKNVVEDAVDAFV